MAGDLTHPEQQPTEAADPNWFREPTPRERWIAAGLFVGFGLFFVLLSFVWVGSWFRWVILTLAAISILRGLRDAVVACCLSETRSDMPGSNAAGFSNRKSKIENRK